jgi:hypothetical protein
MTQNGIHRYHHLSYTRDLPDRRRASHRQALASAINPPADPENLSPRL